MSKKMLTATDRMRERAERAEHQLRLAHDRIDEAVRDRDRARRANERADAVALKLGALRIEHAGLSAEHARMADDLRAVTGVLDAMLDEMGGEPTQAALKTWVELDGCDESARLARLETALMCILCVWDARRHQPRRPERQDVDDRLASEWRSTR